MKPSLRVWDGDKIIDLVLYDELGMIRMYVEEKGQNKLPKVLDLSYTGAERLQSALHYLRSVSKPL
jgi:hypothetical protein